MANLHEMLANAQNGEAMSELGRQFGLSPQQIQAAVAALLPAISMGLKRATATPEGLGNLLAVVGAQPDLYAMYDDPQVAFSREGRAAGNTALARMFGSPEASSGDCRSSTTIVRDKFFDPEEASASSGRIYYLQPDENWFWQGRPSAPAPNRHRTWAVDSATYCGRSLDKGRQSPRNRVQVQLPKPHRKKMAASGISLGPDRAINFRRAANIARFRPTPVVKLLRAATFSRRSCASLPRQLRRGA